MGTDPSCADVRLWRGELEEAHARYGHVRQVHLIVSESRDRGWGRPTISGWSLRMEPWLTDEWRFILEPAVVEAA